MCGGVYLGKSSQVNDRVNHGVNGMENVVNLENEERKPFMIKGFPVEVREASARAAVKRGETMGTWMARAAKAQAALEKGDAVLPPDQPAQPTVPVSIDTTGLVELMQAVAVLAGMPGATEAVTRETNITARMLLRAARGLPLRPSSRLTGKTRGKTIAILG